ncbi:MAG TPA: sigma-70 family RNA polymerase sigma factor [Ktedonobacterales bacterium]
MSVFVVAQSGAPPHRYRLSWLALVIAHVRYAARTLAMRDEASIPSEIPSAALPGEMGGMSHGTTVNGERRDTAAQVDALYQRHAHMVLGYLYRRLPTLTDAEDVLADVFLAAMRQCAHGDEPGPGWLLLVARRRVADFYRERQRMPAAYEPVPGASLAEVEDTHPQPEDVMIRAEERLEIAALIAQLPEEQREALALRFGAGLRSPQIAEVLGKTDQATRALLSRAVRRLRKEWVR